MEAIRSQEKPSRETARPSSPTFERHYSVPEVASMWNLSEDAIRRIFEKEPDVLVIENRKRGKRRHRTLRIPESVLLRVHGRLSFT